jgi:DNA primase
LTNTGGILGTGISDQQVKIVAKMRPRKIYLMFDKDTAGVRNIEIATQKLRRYPLYICRFPKGKKDPAELSRKEAMRSIERAVPASTWMAKNFPNATRQKGLAIHG